LTEEAYPTGSVVLVPFPFTDLSGRKRLPALVVSPNGFDEEDLVPCAITSRFPERFSDWEASLGAEDMVEEKLPRRSVVKVGKLFTMHCTLIARQFGTVKQYKLEEILSKLRTFFARPARISEPDSEDREAGLKTEEVDEAVLGLLYLNVFGHHGQVRAWKTFDWDALDRLHELGLIGDPKSKAKSVPLTAEGLALAEEFFSERFAQQ
jgi:mRNA-degrading endonuclease toxin of MazEF toxin-antitoxin module